MKYGDRKTCTIMETDILKVELFRRSRKFRIEFVMKERLRMERVRGSSQPGMTGTCKSSIHDNIERFSK